MDINDVKKVLSSILAERIIKDDAQITDIRRVISEWANSVKNHEHIDLGSKIELLSIIDIPVFIVSLKTQYERRSLKKDTRPYTGGLPFPLVSVTDNTSIWSVSLAPVEPFINKTLSYIISGSENVSPCKTCNGNGRLQCGGCGGAGRVTCDNCGGKGEVKCKTCHGVGEIKCSRCWGKGQITEKLSSQYNYREIHVNCPGCGGRGANPCSECRHGWTNCNYCGGTTYLTCGICRGSGAVTCDTCEGRTHLLSSVLLRDIFSVALIDDYVKHASVIPETMALVKKKRWTGEICIDYSVGEINREDFNFQYHESLRNAILKLLDQTKKDSDSEEERRILQQRLIVEKLDVINISYEYSGKQYSLWIYGKGCVFAPVNPISEYRENIFSKAQKEFGDKRYSEALDLIERAIAISNKNEYIVFKRKTIHEIHEQYMVGGSTGGIIVPLAGNLLGAIVGGIYKNIFSTKLKDAKKRFLYPFWTSLIINVPLFALISIYLFLKYIKR